MDINEIEVGYENLCSNIPNEQDYILYVYDFLSLKSMIEDFYQTLKQSPDSIHTGHVKKDITDLYYKICRITDNIPKDRELIHQEFMPFYANLEYKCNLQVDDKENIEILTNRYIIEFSYKKVTYNGIDFYYINNEGKQ